MRWYRPLFLLSLVAAFPTTACTAQTTGPGGCASDSDCKGNRVCIGGQCTDSGGGNTNTGTGGNTGSSCSGTACSCTSGGGIDCCEQGTIKSYDCGSTCADHGYESNGCQSGACQCGAPTDQLCATGVAALCKCGEWAGSAPCTDTQWTTMYDNCHMGTSATTFLKCWGQQVNGSSIDCPSAQAACGQYAP